MSVPVPEFGAIISLITSAGIRYEGCFDSVDLELGAVRMTQVRSFGTENRETRFHVAPQTIIYPVVFFRCEDIHHFVVVASAANAETHIVNVAFEMAKAVAANHNLPQQKAQNIGTEEKAEQKTEEKEEEKAEQKTVEKTEEKDEEKTEEKTEEKEEGQEKEKAEIIKISGPVPEFGAIISFITSAGIRYEGRFDSVDLELGDVCMTQVRSFGTENRETQFHVAPQTIIYPVVFFRCENLHHIVVVASAANAETHIVNVAQNVETEEKAEQKTEEKTGEKEEEKAEDKTEEKEEEKAEEKAEQKTEEKEEEKAEEKAEEKEEDKAEEEEESAQADLESEADDE